MTAAWTRSQPLCEGPLATGLALLKNAILVAFLLAIFGCQETAPTTAPIDPTPSGTVALAPTPTTGAAALPALLPLNVEPAFPDLEFRGLTNLVQPPGGDDRLFVTEQPGRVLAFSNDPEGSEVDVVLDLRDRVNDSGSEEGLLGLAFDPGFYDNGHLYVYYSASNPRRSVVSRFSMDRAGYGGAAEILSELVLMEVEQPYRNHNSGQLAFGPDGYLYISLGDGGSGGDPPRQRAERHDTPGLHLADRRE